jgi:hypothetical protein
MKVLQVVAAGLLTGAVVGLLGALLRPRRKLSGDGYSPLLTPPDVRPL